MYLCEFFVYVFLNEVDTNVCMFFYLCIAMHINAYAFTHRHICLHVLINLDSSLCLRCFLTFVMFQEPSNSHDFSNILTQSVKHEVNVKGELPDLKVTYRVASRPFTVDLPKHQLIRSSHGSSTRFF